LVTWGNEIKEFANCMSEKFEMDLPIENLASSKTLEMKEVVRSKRPTPTSTIPTSTPMPLGVKKTSEMKEAIRTGCKSNSDCGTGKRCVNGNCEITTTSLKESGPCKSNSDCPPNMACYNNKCSITTSSKYKEVKEAMDCECLKTCVCPTGCYCRCKNGTCTCTDSYTGGDCTNSSGTKISKSFWQENNPTHSIQQKVKNNKRFIIWLFMFFY
jgi:hypothetical protein